MTAVKVATVAAGIILLAAATVLLLEVVNAIAYLGLAFLYVLSGGVS